MNRDAFFASLRSRTSGVFGPSLSKSQVDGLNVKLDVWAQWCASEYPATSSPSGLGRDLNLRYGCSAKMSR